MTATHDTSQLRGSFTALVTPFTGPDAGSVDEQRLAEQVQFQAEGGITGVVPCGTTGESPTLTEAEHIRVVEKTIEVARPLGLTVIAGAGSNNTAHAVHLHREAARAGADAALHVTPYYNKPSQEGLFRHFTAIADAADLPIVLYNIPGRTNVALTLDTLQRLAEHPNIVAIKEATGSVGFAAEVAEATDLVLLSGDDPLTLPLGSIGGSGVISVLGNVLPGQVAAMVNAMLQQKWEQARSMHNSLLPLAKALLTLDVNPVPVKTAMQLLGRDNGLLRLPLAPMTSDAAAQLKQVMAGYPELSRQPTAAV